MGERTLPLRSGLAAGAAHPGERPRLPVGPEVHPRGPLQRRRRGRRRLGRGDRRRPPRAGFLRRRQDFWRREAEHPAERAERSGHRRGRRRDQRRHFGVGKQVFELRAMPDGVGHQLQQPAEASGQGVRRGGACPGRRRGGVERLRGRYFPAATRAARWAKRCLMRRIRSVIRAMTCNGSRSPPIIATTARLRHRSSVAKDSAGVGGALDTRAC